jgi:hypothetical protein
LSTCCLLKNINACDAKKLEGGDRRSIGRSNEVAAEALAEPSLFAEILSGMLYNPVLYVITFLRAFVVKRLSHRRFS